MGMAGELRHRKRDCICGSHTGHTRSHDPNYELLPWAEIQSCATWCIVSTMSTRLVTCNLDWLTATDTSHSLVLQDVSNPRRPNPFELAFHLDPDSSSTDPLRLFRHHNGPELLPNHLPCTGFTEHEPMKCKLIKKPS